MIPLGGTASKTEAFWVIQLQKDWREPLCEDFQTASVEPAFVSILR